MIAPLACDRKAALRYLALPVYTAGQMECRPSRGRLVDFFYAWLVLPCFCLTLAARVISAQGPPPSAARAGVIEGTVVDAATGLPLEGAILTLQREGATTAASAVSGEDGAFRFKALQAGAYHLSAWRVGYLQRAYGQRGQNFASVPLKLAPGEHRGSIVFRLLHAAAISGHVVDENGDPVLRVKVQAMQFYWNDGRRQLGGGRSAMTDDRGAYRIFGLAPGRYYVFASYSPGNDGTPGNPLGFVPTFYPGTADASAAADVTLHSGDDLTGYDITLASEHPVSVRGSIPVGADVINNTGYYQWIWLYRVDATLGVQFFEQTSPDNEGRFVFTDVPPGTYLLRWQPSGPGRQPDEEATQTIHVGDSDVDGVNLLPQPGLTVDGSVHVEDGEKVNLNWIGIDLYPTGPSLRGGRVSNVRTDGTFSVASLQDGTYRLQVSNIPPDFYLKSAHAGGQDVLSAGLTISHEQPVGTLEIALSPNAGHITGMVVNQGEPLAGGIVTLIATNPRQGVPFWFRDAITDGNGRFAFDGLTPGEYTLCAWEQLPSDFGDPALLPSLKASGEDVQVPEGSRLNVTLGLTSSKQIGE